MKKILFFGEPLIRFTPLNNEKINDNVLTSMHYGGSEINIARTLSGLGIATKVFTGLPANSVGRSFASFMKQNKIDTSTICFKGERVGLYYLENGYGIRASDVYYDRKNTSINDIDILNIKMDILFQDITHFHFSGITVAISPAVRTTLHVLLREAKERNITISMDLNLRTKMISIEDAKKQFSIFAKYADYCFGIEPLMINSDDTNMFNRNNATIQMIQERMQILKDVFNFKAILHTVRNVNENQVNSYQCYLLADQFYTSINLKTALLERVGSGDAFVAGALYKLINEAPLQEVIDFAVAAGTLKCTIKGDSMFESVDKINNLLKSKQEISR